MFFFFKKSKKQDKIIFRFRLIVGDHVVYTDIFSLLFSQRAGLVRSVRSYKNEWRVVVAVNSTHSTSLTCHLSDLVNLGDNKQ